MEEKEEEESRSASLIAIPDHQVPSDQVPDAVGCLARIRKFLPDSIGVEMRKIIALSGPAFLYQLMIYMISIVSSIFCGHLGKVELDAVSLAIAVVNISGVAVGAGLSGACDTLISQIYGGRNLKLVGTVLQRGILILLLFCFPCWALFLNTEPILLLCRQNPDVSRLTQVYVLIFIPALPASFLYRLQAKYLQNQGIIFPQVLTGLIANIFNALINYLFLYVIGLGVMGSAWANTISQYVQAILLFGYIAWRKLYVDTWGGWTTACFEEWGAFIRLAIPSMLMLCIEWWTFEIGIILAGVLGVEDLGAQSIIYQIANIVFMVPVGYSIAASVRVGHSLGAGDIAQAKKSMVVALLMTEGCTLASCILLISLKEVIAYIYTTDQEIVKLVSYVVPVYAVCHLFDGCVATCGGILRGTGKQKIGAIFHAVGNYVVCLPVAVSLMFAAKIGIIGFWVGALLCAFLQCIGFLTFVFHIDWNKASQEAQERAKERQQMVLASDSNPAIYQRAYVTDAREESKTGICNELETAETPDSVEIKQSRAPYHKKPMSKRELIVRRSLVLIAAIAVLMIGILIRLCTDITSIDSGSDRVFSMSNITSIDSGSD
ncbi:multidrug and toxin extrusion protein 1-like isoform 1-T3 [Mantella aurantiaca]